MSVTAANLTMLKAEAKRRASESSIPLEQARDQIARENGFSTWAVMLRQVESPLDTTTPRRAER